MTGGDIMSNSLSVALYKTDPSVFQKSAQMISPAKLADTRIKRGSQVT